MAWQFVGFMHPLDRDVAGPLPCKRWIRVRGEKYKMTYRPRKYAPARGDGTTEKYNADRAEFYARWLAARDGVKLPVGLKVRAVWSGFYSAYRKARRRSWAGVREVPVYCKRVCAVEWGREEARYATRKDGRRGAWTHNAWVSEVRIEIPHWDFEHPPVEGLTVSELDFAG